MSRRIWRFVSVLGFLVLLWAAFRPEPIPQYTQDFDKWTHLIAFGGLTFAVLLAFPRWSLVLVCTALTLVGVGIEFGQDWFLPKRSFDWEDCYADFAGVVIGGILGGLARYLTK